MKKTFSIAVIAVFLGFIGLFFFLNLLTPDRAFSPRQRARYVLRRAGRSSRRLQAAHHRVPPLGGCFGSPGGDL